MNNLPQYAEPPCPSLPAGPAGVEEDKGEVQTLGPGRGSYTSQAKELTKMSRLGGAGSWARALLSEPRHWASVHSEGTCPLHQRHQGPLTQATPSS